MRLWRQILASTLVGLLAACGGGEHDDLRTWMAEASQGLRGNVKALPEVKPYEPVSYLSHDAVEPFEPSRIRLDPERGAGILPDMDRPREPLEEFSLENMQFVGYFKDKDRVVAQILVNGKSYDVKKGQFMGQNFGKVLAIDVSKDEEHILLKELIQEADGAWVERESTLYLMGRGGQG
jgi:type IV pilus assembly protein PilP